MLSSSSANPPTGRPIITLMTDFGMDDWYVASMKAVLLSRCREAHLVDVTHRVPRGDILCGSISLERTVAGFPAGTVHLAVVDPGVGSARRILVVEISGQFVVCPDNGLISWAWHRQAGGRAYELTWRPPKTSSTFHGRDIMAPAAAELACGGSTPASLGRPISDPILLDAAPAEGETGSIIHVDRFGNLTTNLPAEAVQANPRSEVHAGCRNFGPLKRTYTDVTPGQPLALLGSSGLLEIAVRDDSAAEILKLGVGDRVWLCAPEQTTARLRELDKRHIWHPFTPMSLWLDSEPLVICAADGMYLIDSDGRRYLDGVSSLWCNVHGHRVPEIDDAIRRQLDRVAHTTMLGLASEPSIVLADRLMQIVPQNLKKVFYSDSGATATEIAFKMAVQYWYNVGQPRKTEFVALAEAYHGDTVGAMSVGRTTAFHKPYFPLLFKVHYAPTPFAYRPPTVERNGDAASFGDRNRDGSGFSSPGVGGEINRDGSGYFSSPRARQDEQASGSNAGASGAGGVLAEAVKRYCLGELELLLQQHHGTIAAIAIEPVVQGAAGMIVQPPGYLAEVRRLADQYDVLLICDEVATGFGRTGRMFACEHEGVAPDLMCVAKGISGGYLPLAATFATQRIFDAFLGAPAEGKTFFHGHTYTGNALACAAAIASLDLMQQRNLVAAVAQKAEELAKMLAPLADLPHVGDIRQQGFMVGIELVADKLTRRSFDPARRVAHQVCAKLRARGVILRPLGDVIVLMPPLAMELGDLRTIVSALGAELSLLSQDA